MTKDEFTELLRAISVVANHPLFDMSNTKYGFMSERNKTGIDYSEQVTEPDVVLSMEDIWHKYCATGQIAGLAPNGMSPVVNEFVDDEDMTDPEFDDMIDVKQVSQTLKSRSKMRATASAASENAKEVNREKSDVRADEASEAEQKKQEEATASGDPIPPEKGAQ